MSEIRKLQAENEELKKEAQKFKKQRNDWMELVHGEYEDNNLQRKEINELVLKKESLEKELLDSQQLIETLKSKEDKPEECINGILGQA